MDAEHSGGGSTKAQNARRNDEGVSGSENGIKRLDVLLDVPLDVTVELGRARMTIQELLSLHPGSVVELDKLAGDALDILINGRLVAKGEAVVVKEKFGIRVSDVVSASERIARLR